jgi:putative PIN family toxin of toxin-antitoxin system
VRVVFDTNVVLSASFRADSTASRALRLAIVEHEVVISPQLWLEMEQVLLRPKFDRIVLLEERQEFLRLLLSQAIVVRPINRHHICRDPKDDMIIDAAVAGQAAAIVTGDKDVLALNPFQGIAVLTPADFLMR